tara:strand:- start:668 stop:859 length:192 start_codon:yes stop_codon:yes gene_type:complete
MNTNKLRVDVDYIISRLEEIVNPANVENTYSVVRNDYTDSVSTTEIKDFLNELKQNMENHNGR